MERTYLNLDCMDADRGLPSYPDKYFDLAIVDPPYGINHGKHRAESFKSVSKSRSAKWETPKVKEYKAFDDSRPPDKIFFDELFRVSKHQIIWGANNFTMHLPPSSSWVAWDKMVADNELLSQVELAFTSFEGRARRFQFLWAGFKKAEQTNRIHPTEKPIALYRWLLKNYAKGGMRLLDTHVGSASSLVAFEEMGFEYVAFEKDPDYYRDSCKRLEAHRKQQSLFTGQEIFKASGGQEQTLF